MDGKNCFSSLQPVKIRSSSLKMSNLILAVYSTLPELKSSILTLKGFPSVIVELYFMILAFDSVSLCAVFLSKPMINLSSLIPISIAGLGVREGVGFYLLSRFQVSGHASVSAVFLSFLVNYLLLAVIGVFFMPRTRMLSSGKNNSTHG